jgi:hypothetical protein
MEFLTPQEILSATPIRDQWGERFFSGGFQNNSRLSHSWLATYTNMRHIVIVKRRSDLVYRITV